MSAISKKAFFILLIDLTRRDFKLRYTGSLLGSYWNLIHPVFMISIYIVVFSQVMRAKLGSSAGPFSYSIYLCSGIIAWNFFSETVSRGTNTLLENAAFLKKVSIPAITFFASTFCSAFVNFLITHSIFVIVLGIIAPQNFGLYLLSFLIAFWFGITGMLASVSLGCLNVFIRDIQQMVQVLFQLWFWFTPIVYLGDLLPEFAKKLLIFNPAFPYIRSMQRLLYHQTSPLALDLGLMCIWTTLGAAIAFFIYNKSISLVRDQL